jgi:hypothetical protein
MSKTILQCKKCGKNDFTVYEILGFKAVVDERDFLVLNKNFSKEFQIECNNCDEKYNIEDFEEIEYNY